ncbi:Transketolase, thiamine diphosphate binding domain-containing protein [Aspergillus pseudotamarii]|uniref:Transketolase, thiamine diphosphate binding domain-containing protein n=1 Tax=Aspergillus pseudotamarii TaxID=132259 RepID=A0A5N6TC08_ASPPS|nr:Transketolase, thiamine diphosphate binding domain-containing protein [Aspergillus pseudotamarii]KAE8143807.1 Transketolase, thiamine diphosphate binding domain-containing protein [Aspergillus pseudotamarii]
MRDDESAVRDIRKLVIDCCRQNGGGHGGSAIGMAPLGVALWKHEMRYNPHNPNWFDRDRFVLSNGHAAIFLYTMLHVSGYPHMTLDELKLYASAKKVDLATGKWQETICHGHPEIEIPGVEVTTGPLGQGIANAVGLAFASKSLAGQFNRPGHEIIQSRIYCSTGDGCLQEGIAQEAMAIAGHLQLDNLVLCYDNNGVTCDGPLDWIVSEKINDKMTALGWHVIDVFTGDTSVSDIVAALQLAKAGIKKPVFLNIRTTIGYGTSTAGTAKSHHGTYSDADAQLYSWSEQQPSHQLSDGVKKYMGTSAANGQLQEDDWHARLEIYCKGFPHEGKLLLDRISGTTHVSQVLEDLQLPKEPKPTRELNGLVFNHLLDNLPQIMAGGADLWNSNQLGDQSHRIYDSKHPQGQVVRYGIREHAMAAISNGLAAYSPRAFIPITATFFMFYLYAAPAVRMGALSHLPVIHIATHDSIGEGQNGPTHQPVEVDSLYRAMPNLFYIRPCDAVEVLGAWKIALSSTTRPTIISLARDKPEYVVRNTSRESILRGGYTVVEHTDAEVTLISCGSELQFAVAAADQLTEEGVPTRVVSMPCMELFEEQSASYKLSVLSASQHIISVEAYVSTMWARYCTASIAMDSFGYSGLGRENFIRFGLDPAGIVRKVYAHVAARKASGDRLLRWELLK